MLFKLEERGSLSSWDSFDAFVVRAENEREARELAQREIADEKRVAEDFWLNDGYSKCVVLKETGVSEVILGSFNAG